MGSVPSNFEEIGDQVYLVPSNFCDWLLFFPTKYCTQEGIQCFPPDLLARFKVERK